MTNLYLVNMKMRSVKMRLIEMRYPESYALFRLSFDPVKPTIPTFRRKLH